MEGGRGLVSLLHVTLCPSRTALSGACSGLRGQTPSCICSWGDLRIALMWVWQQTHLVDWMVVVTTEGRESEVPVWFPPILPSPLLVQSKQEDGRRAVLSMRAARPQEGRLWWRSQPGSHQEPVVSFCVVRQAGDSKAHDGQRVPQGHTAGAGGISQITPLLRVAGCGASVACTVDSVKM